MNLLKWCFIIEENGVFLGRAIYGVFREQPTDLKIWQFLIDADVERIESNDELLLKESLSNLNENGFETVEYHMYSTTNNNDVMKFIFERQGFRVIQEKKSFEIELKNSIKTHQRLTYKNWLSRVKRNLS
jgi:hypothetical protein